MRLIYYFLSLLYNNLKETTFLVADLKCIWFRTVHDKWKEESRGTWIKGDQSFCISGEKFQIRKPMVLVPERSFKHSPCSIMHTDPSGINIVADTFFTSLEESLWRFILLGYEKYWHVLLSTFCCCYKEPLYRLFKLQ